MPDTTPPSIAAWIEQHPEIRNFFLALVDLNGVLRGKRLSPDQAAKAIDGTARFPLSAVALDVWGTDVEDGSLVFQSGDADGLCDWTGRMPLKLAGLSANAAYLPVMLMNEDRSDFAGDPRQALKAVVKRYAARKLMPVVALELEFYIVDPLKDRPDPPVSPVSGNSLGTDSSLSLRDLEHFSPLLDAVYATCEAHDIPLDSAISENGPGQFELNFKHTDDPLRAADDAIFFKEIVKKAARAHGYAATFMAKPYGDRAGNGLHVHHSLLNTAGENVFDDGTAKGSAAMHNAVAGLLRAMPGSTLIFAPHSNSYRRLRPHSHAPSTPCWGYENRTVAIRIPGGSATARRIEHRVAGADANPYLVLAAILGAALDGQEKGLTPPAPIAKSAYEADLEDLPTDWLSAINLFETSPEVESLLPDLLRRLFVECKRQEAEVFARNVTDFEYLTYLEEV